MSLAGDYGSDLLHCCRHHQPVGVVLALAHFLQLSLAGKFIKKATDVLLKVFTFLTKFFFFFTVLWIFGEKTRWRLWRQSSGSNVPAGRCIEEIGQRRHEESTKCGRTAQGEAADKLRAKINKMAAVFFWRTGEIDLFCFFVGRWKRVWMGPLNGQAIGTSLWSTTPKSAIFHFCRQVQRFFNYIKLATDDPAVASGRIKSGSALLYIPSRSWPGVCIRLQNFR